LYASAFLVRQARCPDLDLGMAVRAQQHALARLGASSRERSGHAVLTEREALFAGQQVMKLKRREAP
jgi:hypothetical protein